MNLSSIKLQQNQADCHGCDGGRVGSWHKDPNAGTDVDMESELYLVR